MAWTDEMPLMLRYIIGDVDVPQKYTDNRLQTSLLVSCKFVSAEANFSQVFVSNLTAMTLTPDPTVDPTIDDWYSNLVVLKSACQIIQAEEKLLTNGGAIMFKEGSAMVDMRDLARHKKELLTEVLSQYDNAMLNYKMGVRPSCAAVIGPINIIAGNMRGPMYPYTTRDRVFI
jgi:hypothetical protein